MSFAADVVIVGGEPAGSVAAIWAAATGLRVTLLEKCEFPRHRPCETLHPGVESILRQLGVEARVAAASAMRLSAISVRGGRSQLRQPFGADGHGEWKGYQLLREDLDSI